MKQFLLKILLIALIALWGWFSAVDISMSSKMRLADQWLAARHPVEAENLYRQVINVEPWRKPGWVDLARQYYSRREPDRVLSVLEPLAKADNLGTDGWLLLAQIYEQTGRLSEVEPALTTARNISKEPSDIRDSLEALVRFYRSQGRFSDALDCQNDLLFAVASTDQGLVTDRILLQALSDLNSAITEWKTLDTSPPWLKKWASTMQFASIETDETRRWMLMGQAYAAAGIWDMAEYAFLKTTDSSPDYAGAWALLAEARQEQGKDGRAQIERALELDPGSQAVRLAAALYYRRQSNFEKSITLLNENIKTEPEKSLWYLELGRTLADAGKLEEALSVFQQVVEKHPDDVVNLLALSRFCIQREYRLDDIGQPAAEKAVKLAPDSAEALDVLGQVYFSLGDVQSAKDTFNQVIKKNADYTPVWLHLGQLALSEQNSSDAREYLGKANTLGGDTTEGRLAARLIQQYFPGLLLEELVEN